MRRRWKRFLRRRQKLLIVLTLISLINIVYPQHATAFDDPRVRGDEETGTPEVIANEAVKPVGQRGQSDQLLPVIQPLPAKRTMVVVATAYTSTVAETDSDPFTTASGAKVADDVIAMNGMPFGTKVRLPDHYGDKVFTVLDRMSPRYGRNHIDLWMPTKAQAKQWGVRSVRMEVL